MNRITVIALVVVVASLVFTGADGRASAGTTAISSPVDMSAVFLSGAVPGDGETGSDNATVTLRNPSFSEMKEFILADATSRNEFVLNEYECRHFATDVNNNAEAAGLHCAVVLLCFRSGQHAVVAFETTDRGLVYIEPQTDAAIHPEVGGTYQGQPIQEILVIW